MKPYGLMITSASVVVMFAACGGDDPVLDGVHYQYVVSELRMPSSQTAVRVNSLDLDRDGAVDNRLGQVFATLAGNGLGVGDTATEALLRGGLVMLAELETTSFNTSGIAGFTTHLGSDPEPAPCLDPARLETCGQHLLGQGHFTVDADSTSDQAIGPIARGGFLDSVGVMPVEIAINADTPLRLDLHGAHVRLSEISADHISGIFGGAITRADVEGLVIPEAAAQMDRIVRAECDQPTGTPTCGCIVGSRAKLLQDLFDANDDCRLDAAELSTNGLVQNLLAPDVTVDGQLLLSFGVGIELTAATFTSP